MLKRLQQVHPLHWLAVAAGILVTLWTQFGGVLGPIMPGHSGQALTAIILVTTLFLPKKPSIPDKVASTPDV
jgi:hypothetical protein